MWCEKIQLHTDIVSANAPGLSFTSEYIPAIRFFKSINEQTYFVPHYWDKKCTISAYTFFSFSKSQHIYMYHYQDVI